MKFAHHLLRMLFLLPYVCITIAAFAADGTDLAKSYRQALELRESRPALFAGAAGIMVVSIQDNGAAASLNIREGDVWLHYRGEPIASMEAFLAARVKGASEGQLRFLRDAEPGTLTLPPGQLGVGLVGLVALDLDVDDAALFFDFLAAAFADDTDAASNTIRQHRDTFERIQETFASGSADGRPGAAQLTRWADELRTILIANTEMAKWEERSRQLEAESKALEQQLAEVGVRRQELERQAAETAQQESALGTLKLLADKGEQAFTAGQIEEARHHWNQALTLAEGLEWPAAEAVFAANLARAAAAWDEGKSALALAERAYARAAAINAVSVQSSRVPFLVDLPDALVEIGDVWLRAGAADRAENAFARAQTVAAALEQPFDEFRALQRRSTALIELGDSEQAVAVAKAAVNVAEKLPVPDEPEPGRRVLSQAVAWSNQALALQQLSQALSTTGDQAEAIDVLERALERCERVQAIPLATIDSEVEHLVQPIISMTESINNNATRQLALIYELKGDHVRALPLYQELLKKAVIAQDFAAQIEALSSIADTHKALGDPLAAVSSLKEAASLATKSEDIVGIHRIEMALAVLYLELGDFARVIEHANKAVQSARRFPHRLDDDRLLTPNRRAWYAERETIALSTLATGYLLGPHDWSKAKTHYKEALDVATAYLSGTKREVDALSSMATMHAVSGEHNQAIDLLKRAIQILREHGTPQLRIAERGQEVALLSMLAEVCISADRLDEAKAYLTQAEDVLSPHDPMGPLGIREAHARLALLQNDPASAEQLLRDNLESIDATYQQLSADELTQMSFGDVYSSNANLLLWALLDQGKETAALMLAEQQRGRTLTARFAAKIDAAASFNGLDSAKIAQIAAEHEATLIYYTILYDPKAHLLPGRFGGQQPNNETELLIWVVPPGGQPALRRVDLVRPREASGLSLTELALGRRMERREAPSAPGANPGNEHALVEADAPLPEDRSESRGATHLKEDLLELPQRLSLLHELMIAPVADLLPPPDSQLVFVPQGSLLLTPFAALQDDNGEYLVKRYSFAVVPAAELLELTRQLVGEHIQHAPQNGNAVLVVGDPLQDLAYAKQEAKAVAQLLGQPAPLLGPEATKRAVLARMPGAHILHFAAHGELDDHAIGAPGAIRLAPEDEEDGRLTAEEILDLDLTADLAVLSACDTGRGRVTGDGIVGLSYAFVRAGVPSVVVSLWQVPDVSTSKLMIAFYEARRNGANNSEALRRAMLSTIETGYDHPSQWAGFSLIGQW